MRATLERWRKNVTDPKTDFVLRETVPMNTERPLSRQAQQAIEAHYVEVTTLATERDNALARLEDAKKLCTQASHEIHGLKDEIANLKATRMTYQIERDKAVSEASTLREVLADIAAKLRRHEISPTQHEAAAITKTPLPPMVDIPEPVLTVKRGLRGGYQAPEGGQKPKAPTTGSGAIHENVR